MQLTTAQVLGGSTVALTDYGDTAITTGVQMITASNSVLASPAGNHGVTPTAGDAAEIFGGIVNVAGNYQFDNVNDWITHRFTGLDPARTYTLAATANRGGVAGDYPTRFTTWSLQGAAGFANASSTGTIADPPGSADAIRFSTGDNTVKGYVARWTGIQPGADGEIVLRVQRSAAAGGSVSYGTAALMLALEGQ